MELYNCCDLKPAFRVVIDLDAVTISTSAHKRPVSLIGAINKKTTKGRPTPPSPICGFKTDYTPFDKGHIFALELGGPDIAENIVPQYSLWQETGKWRQDVENAIGGDGNTDGGFFVAVVEYASAHEDYTKQSGWYQNTPPMIFDWKDQRIPSQFSIWVVAKDTTKGSLWKDIDDFVKPGKLDNLAYDALLLRVKGTSQYLPTLDHTKMPKEDRDHIHNEQIAYVAWEYQTSYLAERDEQIETQRLSIEEALEDEDEDNRPEIEEDEVQTVADLLRSPVRDEDVFMTTYHDALAEELKKLTGPTATDVQWDASELTAVDPARVLKAVFETSVEKPLLVSKIKARNKRAAQFKATFKDNEKKREAFKKKGVKYKEDVFKKKRGQAMELDPKTQKPL
jgi:hypothetical protein